MSRYTLMVMVCLGCCSCSEDRTVNWKDTWPVTGVVLVDGKPADELAVKCHPAEGVDQANPTTSAAFTDKDGKFSLSTYKDGDGLPPGEYTLTFVWGKWNYISMNYGGPDKLNDRYSDPEKSKWRVKVAGAPVDLGKIELTTQ